MRIAAGLDYSTWTYQESRVHMLRIDLAQRTFRPVMDKQEFPFNEGHPQTKAIETGAVACGPGGFNITLYHGLGIQDQPQHALVVDNEIWTTGLGAGGYGVLIGDGWVKCQRNRIEVHVWKGGTSFEVEHVNRGHEGEVVAFTQRGGTNEYPKYRGKHFYSLIPAIDVPGQLIVQKVAMTPPKVWPDQIVLEATHDLNLVTGDTVIWKQDLIGARHIVSGWPLILDGGENVVPDYELDPEASRGPDAWFVRRNPRTALGANQDGSLAYMICVEGRLPNTYRPLAPASRGLRLKGLAETAKRHGIWSLVNMDGGGSAFQWTINDEAGCWGCYNSAATISAQRRAHFSISVF